MNIAMLLEMVADSVGDQVAVGSRDGGGLTYAQLFERSAAGAALLGERLVAVDINSEAIPIGIFSAALAGVPYVPVNYRLADERLRAIVERAAPATAVVEPEVVARISDIEGLHVMERDEFLRATTASVARPEVPFDPEAIAVLLFTSGTTGEPKAAVLRHLHL